MTSKRSITFEGAAPADVPSINANELTALLRGSVKDSLAIRPKPEEKKKAPKGTPRITKVAPGTRRKAEANGVAGKKKTKKAASPPPKSRFVEDEAESSADEQNHSATESEDEDSENEDDPIEKADKKQRMKHIAVSVKSEPTEDVVLGQDSSSSDESSSEEEEEEVKPAPKKRSKASEAAEKPKRSKQTSRAKTEEKPKAEKKKPKAEPKKRKSSDDEEEEEDNIDHDSLEERTYILSSKAVQQCSNSLQRFLKANENEAMFNAVVQTEGPKNASESFKKRIMRMSTDAIDNMRLSAESNVLTTLHHAKQMSSADAQDLSTEITFGRWCHDAPLPTLGEFFYIMTSLLHQPEFIEYAGIVAPEEFGIVMNAEQRVAMLRVCIMHTLAQTFGTEDMEKLSKTSEPSAVKSWVDKQCKKWDAAHPVKDREPKVALGVPHLSLYMRMAGVAHADLKFPLNRLYMIVVVRKLISMFFSYDKFDLTKVAREASKIDVDKKPPPKKKVKTEEGGVVVPEEKKPRAKPKPVSMHLKATFRELAKNALNIIHIKDITENKTGMVTARFEASYAKFFNTVKNLADDESLYDKMFAEMDPKKDLPDDSLRKFASVKFMDDHVKEFYPKEFKKLKHVFALATIVRSPPYILSGTKPTKVGAKTETK